MAYNEPTKPQLAPPTCKVGAGDEDGARGWTDEDTGVTFSNDAADQLDSMKIGAIGGAPETHETPLTCIQPPNERLASKASKDDLLKEQWSPLRRTLDRVLSSLVCEIIMGCVVVFNVAVMVFEANDGALCDDSDGGCVSEWITLTDYVLLGVYTLDCGLRVFIDRARFLFNRWNVLDATIVGSAYVDVLVALLAGPGGSTPVLKILRMLRVMRVLRIVRLFKPLPELYQLIRGFASTMSAIWWGFVMIMVLLVMCSLLTVQVVQQDNRKLTDHLPDGDWCKDAFSSVQLAILFFFQTLVAGDSWGTCLVPLIRSNWLFFLIFAIVLLIIQVGFVNLILSVIVDSAASAREEDAEKQLEDKLRRQKEDLQMFYEVMSRIDEDASGTVSLQELLDGYDMDDGLQTRFDEMSIRREDLQLLFELMDFNNTGGLSYSEFIGHMDEANRQDIRVQLMKLKLHMGRLYHMQLTCNTQVDEIHKALVPSARCSRPDSPSSWKVPLSWQLPEVYFETVPLEVVSPLKGIFALEQELHQVVATLEVGLKSAQVAPTSHSRDISVKPLSNNKVGVAGEDTWSPSNGANHKGESPTKAPEQLGTRRRTQRIGFQEEILMKHGVAESKDTTIATTARRSVAKLLIDPTEMTG